MSIARITAHVHKRRHLVDYGLQMWSERDAERCRELLGSPNPIKVVKVSRPHRVYESAIPTSSADYIRIASHKKADFSG